MISIPIWALFLYGITSLVMILFVAAATTTSIYEYFSSEERRKVKEENAKLLRVFEAACWLYKAVEKEPDTTPERICRLQARLFATIDHVRTDQQ